MLPLDCPANVANAEFIPTAKLIPVTLHIVVANAADANSDDENNVPTNPNDINHGILYNIMDVIDGNATFDCSRISVHSVVLEKVLTVVVVAVASILILAYFSELERYSLLLLMFFACTLR